MSCFQKPPGLGSLKHQLSKICLDSQAGVRSFNTRAVPKMRSPPEAPSHCFRIDLYLETILKFGCCSETSVDPCFWGHLAKEICKNRTSLGMESADPHLSLTQAPTSSFPLPSGNVSLPSSPWRPSRTSGAEGPWKPHLRSDTSTTTTVRVERNHLDVSDPGVESLEAKRWSERNVTMHVDTKGMESTN